MADRKIHLALIPDGNRRWAKNRKLMPWDGHRKALENSRALLRWCRDSHRIGAITMWGLSTENWNRDKKEIILLMRLIEEYLKKEKKEFIKNKTRVVHSGRKDRLPQSLTNLLSLITDETKDLDAFTINFALDYGGRDEIIRGINRVPPGLKVTEDLFKNYLDHPELPDIDLVIRTSGEQRTSNFCMWQAAYAEWEFIAKYFPELTPDDLAGAVERFDRRHRRFGG